MPYLASSLATSSATVSERNVKISPLGVLTKRPHPLVSISLSLPDILTLIRYMFVPLCTGKLSPGGPEPLGEREEILLVDTVHLSLELGLGARPSDLRKLHPFRLKPA